MKKHRVVILMLVFLLYGGLIQAELITIQFSGHVTSASGSALPAAISESTTFTGSYTYDPDTPNSSGWGGMGQYVHNSPYGIEILMGGVEFATAANHSGQFEVRITDSLVANYDWYDVISNANNSVNGTPIDSIVWTLGGPPSTISSIALPVSGAAVLVETEDWTINTFTISGQNLLIQGTVTQAVLIPEPLTGALIAIGAFFIKRKR